MPHLPMINMTETFEKVEKQSGWIFEIPAEIAKKEGYEEGSKIILTFKGGAVRAEVLPPPTKEVIDEVDRIIEQYGAAFEELKRLGD